MENLTITRRTMLRRALGALGAAGMTVRGQTLAAPPELILPSGGPEERFDFDAKGIEDWIKVSGQWAVEELDGAPSGKRVLIQRATKNEFNVIVAASGPYMDLDVSMKFKPISGREDASGGIVFRFNDGKYYVVRANALEDNLRLYYYDRERRQLTSARVKAPSLGQWHTVRVVAVGEHIRAWLDGTRYLDHRDARFTAGRVGLCTKADSVTAFDDLTIRGVRGGSSRRLVAEGAAYSSGDAGPLHSETIGARASEQGHRARSPAPVRLRLRHRLNVRRDLRNVEFLQECVVVRAA